MKNKFIVGLFVLVTVFMLVSIVAADSEIVYWEYDISDCAIKISYPDLYCLDSDGQLLWREGLQICDRLEYRGNKFETLVCISSGTNTVYLPTVIN